MKPVKVYNLAQLKAVIAEAERLGLPKLSPVSCCGEEGMSIRASGGDKPEFVIDSPDYQE